MKIAEIVWILVFRRGFLDFAPEAKNCFESYEKERFSRFDIRLFSGNGINVSFGIWEAHPVYGSGTTFLEFRPGWL